MRAEGDAAVEAPAEASAEGTRLMVGTSLASLAASTAAGAAPAAAPAEGSGRAAEAEGLAGERDKAGRSVTGTSRDQMLGTIR